MKTFLLLLALLVPSLAKAQCAETAAGRVTSPQFVSVAVADTDVVVTVGRDSVGFNRTWSMVLSVDTGEPGGYAPYPTACSLQPVYDWYVAMNTFAVFPGCPCPTWFWTAIHGGGNLPVPTTTEILADNTVRLFFSIAADANGYGVPVPIAAGQSYLLTITTVEGSYGDDRRSAWEFLGTINQGNAFLTPGHDRSLKEGR